MTVEKQITRATPYASSEDFRQVFDEHMNSLYQLAFLLTADQKKAEQCFVSGLEDAVEGSPVFKEWAHSWARRAVILNAVRVLSPRPRDMNGRGQSGSDSVDNTGNSPPSTQPAEIASVLGLELFERFVYLMTVRERYSDQECSVLLGCTRKDAVSARTRGLQQLAAEAATQRQHLTASSEKPAWHERRSSVLQLLIAPKLAVSS